ncbi:acid-sensing ion channel 5 [Struthio camelus]|uniref:acid-sensing ion channel 5 n=1 Tax=Struthio camelus TaxID=8801 RepID=UPI003603FFCA
MEQLGRFIRLDAKGLLEKIRLYLIKKLLPRLEDRKKYHQEFASSTSFHGVHNIVQTQSKTRKVLWLLVVMGSLAIVIWQICNRFIYYFSWPTTTSVYVQYVENVEFPAVTFCNLNRFQAHAVINLRIIFFLWSIVSGVLQEIAMKDNFSQELNAFLLGNQNFSIKEFTRENGFYLNSSTLLECEFFGKPCYPEDFEHVFTEYGNCFTFNHNDLPEKRRVSVSGRGLSLLFDVKQAQFTDDPSLGYIDAGITYVIHSPKELPHFDGLGLSTPVGMHAQVAIRHLKTIIQEYPWGECKPDIKLRHHKIYSTYGCLQECKAQYIQDWCGCLPFILPGNGTECDIQKFYNCVYPALYEIELQGLCTAGTHNSTCPVACEETDYPTTVTYSSFAGEKAIKFISAKLKKSPEYIRQNLVHIDIKYHDLNYKMTQQQKALTVAELLADVGGQLGLFCGASMITIIELLEYIFTNFCWMCIFLLLKVPEMPQWNIPPQNQPTHKEEKKGIQEC